MAAAVDGKLEVVTVVDRLADITAAQRSLHDGIAQLGALPVEPMCQVLASDSVATAVADHVESLTGGMVAMSSHGHGRSAAVLGSVTDELLRRLYGPIVVVGPHASPDAGALDGAYVVALDGSDRSEAIVPIVGAWSVEFGGTAWMVEVLDTIAPTTGDVFESAYVGEWPTICRRASATRSSTRPSTVTGRHEPSSTSPIAWVRRWSSSPPTGAAVSTGCGSAAWRRRSCATPPARW
jgi:hypothetical protein